MKITSTHFEEEYLPQIPHKERCSYSLWKQPKLTHIYTLKGSHTDVFIQHDGKYK